MALTLQQEAQWLLDNDHFAERPATLEEFLGPRYLDLGTGVRVGVKQILIDIIGEEVSSERPVKEPLAMSTGGIGIGKTTVASIILAYCVHWCLCLKSPQDFYGLLPGSRIAFGQASTRASQAKEVVFGDLKARILHSPWFKKHPFDKSFKNQMRFPKDIWIVPGDSTETGYEGYNILGFLLDEADSHKLTPEKDYAENAFLTLLNRTKSRFGDRGFGIIIGQMKSDSGFAKRKYDEFRAQGIYTNRMTIWESWGWAAYCDAAKVDLYQGLRPDGTAKRFYYNVERKKIIPEELVDGGHIEVDGENILQIPEVYRLEFEQDPVKALKDLAGIPPIVGDAFITLAERIRQCEERWIDKFGSTGPIDIDGVLAEGHKAPNSIPRVVHIDIGYSPSGDALGFAMGHVPGMIVGADGNERPIIQFDILKQWQAKSGTEIFLDDVRQFIVFLRDTCGYRIKMVTFDGFQSKDFMQILERTYKIPAEYVSMDTQLEPYYDLKDAIYQERMLWPPLRVPSRRHPGQTIDLPYSELSQLVDTGKKIDHTANSTKDLADAMAGVASVLMGDRRFHKRRREDGIASMVDREHTPSSQGHHAFVGGGSPRLPPRTSAGKRLTSNDFAPRTLGPPWR